MKFRWKSHYADVRSSDENTRNEEEGEITWGRKTKGKGRKKQPLPPKKKQNHSFLLPVTSTSLLSPNLIFFILDIFFNTRVVMEHRLPIQRLAYSIIRAHDGALHISFPPAHQRHYWRPHRFEHDDCYRVLIYCMRQIERFGTSR